MGQKKAWATPRSVSFTPFICGVHPPGVVVVCLFVACSINLADAVCKGELKGFSCVFLGTEWQQGHSANTDEISMMQIDCQVMDTKIINIKRSSIPVQHSDSSHFGTPSVTVPNGNAYVKPAK